VLIVGAGAIGSLLGYRLAEGGAQVDVLVRPGAKPLHEEGLGIVPAADRWPACRWRPRTFTTETADLPVPDVVLIATRGEIDDDLLERLGPFADRGVPLVSLLNGLGRVERLREAFAGATVGVGACHVAVVRQNGHLRILHEAQVELGFDASTAPEIAYRLRRALVAGGLGCSISPDSQSAAWRKLVWNVPFDGMSALTGGASIGEIMQDRRVRARLEAIMREVVAAAAAVGVTVPAGEVARLLAAAKLIPEYRESWAVSTRALALLDEFEFVIAEPLRRAESAGVSVPEWRRLHEDLVAGRKVRLTGCSVLAAALPDRPAPAGLPEPISEQDVEDSVHERFKRLAAIHPDRPAIDDGEKSLTYGQLDRRSDALAERLPQCGETPGVIAVLMEHGCDFATAFLGVIKAGHACLPVDPGQPEERIRAICEAAGAQTILTDIPAIETNGTEPAGPVVPVPSAPSRPALLLPTSGSTGTPHVVIHSHASCLHNALRHTRFMAVNGEDRLASVTRSGVYGASRDLLLALLNSASLSVYPTGRLGTSGIPEWMVERRITVYASVVSVFRAFAEHLPPDFVFEHLRAVKCGGEPIRDRDVEQFRRHTRPGCSFFCGLSSTEAGLILEQRYDHTCAVPEGSLPLGRAVDGIEPLVVDERGWPVAPGETGTLALAGHYLLDGYANEPDLDRDRFSPHPMDPGRRILLTGDVVRCDADGLFHLVGRSDRVVKVRGNRVDLGEIEGRLLEHPRVDEVCVLGRDDATSGTRLVAYWSGDPGIDHAELRRHLKRTLPAPLVPSVFTYLERFPRLRSGKIDRQRLPEMPAREARYGDSRSLAAEVSELWQVALGTSEIGPDTDFYEAGGDSLAAIRVLLHLEELLGCRVPFTVFEDSITPRRLAAMLESATPVPRRRLWVELGTRRTGVPIFGLSGAGGSIIGYRNLARALGDDHRVVGLRYPGTDEGRRGSDTISQIAAVLVETIRSLHPDGPYRLVGYSFGGRVALEIARQLRESGGTVDLLCVLDSPMRSAPKLRHLAHRLKRLVWRRKRFQDWVGDGDDVARKVGGWLGRRFRADRKMNRRAAHRHRPQVYEGDMLLIRSSVHRERNRATPDLGWGGLVRGRLEIADVPHPHGVLLNKAGGVTCTADILNARVGAGSQITKRPARSAPAAAGGTRHAAARADRPCARSVS
jgi:2-dehydropantoate 2-reductase